MEDCKAYGGTTVLVVPAVVTPKVSYRDAWTRSQAAIRTLIPDAERHGVKIAIEEVWNKFLLSPVEFARYIDEFQSPWVGAYFDVGNVVEFGYPQEWIRELGKRILKIHIKEYKKEKRFDYPLGEGEIDWPEVRQALHRRRLPRAGSRPRSPMGDLDAHEGRRPADGQGPGEGITVGRRRMIDGEELSAVSHPPVFARDRHSTDARERHLRGPERPRPLPRRPGQELGQLGVAEVGVIRLLELPDVVLERLVLLQARVISKNGIDDAPDSQAVLPS